MDDAACRSFAENLASPIAELSLGPADLTDVGVNALCTAFHMNGLRTLELKYLANLSDEGLTTISTSLLSLQTLRLDWCAFITDRGVAELGALPRLRFLSLKKCRRISDGVLPAFVCQPNGHPPVKIDASETNISQQGAKKHAAAGGGTVVWSR
eukprot:FR740342.1.p1 GENE.FR740342.1~~FR740342.1.p1  ORF type:complete len:171 (+),score=12.76 FR740342.1:54-515(+)